MLGHMLLTIGLIAMAFPAKNYFGGPEAEAWDGLVIVVIVLFKPRVIQGLDDGNRHEQESDDNSEDRCGRRD